MEALESRLLMHTTVFSTVADNRGLIVAQLDGPVVESTVNSNSVEFFTAGPDGRFGTADDIKDTTATVSYNAGTQQIRLVTASPFNQPYRFVLRDTILSAADFHPLDGDFNGADVPSGNGDPGGDYDAVVTPRDDEVIARFTVRAGSERTTIDVRLFADLTPVTVANFLNYANNGIWDETIFHRSLPGFIVQGGGFTYTTTANTFAEVFEFAPVANEPHVTSNVRGTIAMARPDDPNQPPANDRPTNQFFFNLANNASNLDNQNGGFTAFGEVADEASLLNMDALASFVTGDVLAFVQPQSIAGNFEDYPVVDAATINNRGFIQPNVDSIIVERVAILMDIDPTVSRLPSSDFNNDGKPDILFRNTSTGANAVWLMDGATRIGVQLLNSAATSWVIAGNGDLTGDGNTDIVWHNPASGAVALWPSGAPVGVQFFASLAPGSPWRVAGLADMNGDHNLDILFRNTSTGANAVWLMDGTTRLSVFLLPSAPDTNWQLAGAGFMNDDGHPDLLWQRPSTGSVATWLMTNTTRDTVLFLPSTTASTSWRLAGGGDYFNDGDTDLRWYNISTGQKAIWSFEDGIRDGVFALQTGVTDWIMAVG